MKIPNRQHPLPLPLAPLHRRKGISLLEVLISIFIITIGILGVASMLPLATHLANRGAMADRAAVAGKIAREQFRIRGINNPGNWLKANGTGTYVLDPTDANSPLYPLEPKAFCFDPRGVAHNVGNVFPIGGAVTMERFTLQPQAGTDLSALSPAQRQALADEICRMQDDLSFEVPDDPTQLPRADMFNNNNGTPNDPTDDVALKRYSAGDFSWMATLVRETGGDLYTLSVVVFNQRNTPAAADERRLTANFLGGGFGGGDVRLTSTTAANEAQLAVPGQWVMLSDSNGTDQTRIRWYRIVNASEVSGNTRDVTLLGRDWDIANPFSDPQVTLIPGVIAVYERTIRLETSSVW